MYVYSNIHNNDKIYNTLQSSHRIRRILILVHRRPASVIDSVVYVDGYPLEYIEDTTFLPLLGCSGYLCASAGTNIFWAVPGRYIAAAARLACILLFLGFVFLTLFAAAFDEFVGDGEGEQDGVEDDVEQDVAADCAAH